MRRTTLGPVSSSQLNARSSVLRHPSARVSVGAGKSVTERQSIGVVSRRVSTASHGVRRPPAGPRSSVNRQSVGSNAVSGRRSSTYGSRASVSGRGGGRVLDPRPLNDKAYLTTCVGAIVEYLSDHMYDQTLPQGMVRRGPSKKDFCNILLFLFKQVDPTFEFGVKFEEDVVVQFRNLRYPIPISKTSLAAVGTPHTWPTLLLSISWLIELLTYDEAIQQANEVEQTDENDEENGDKPFFKYLGGSYRVFLAGEDDKFAALEREEREKLIDRNEVVKQETNELKRQRHELKARIEKAKQEKSAMSSLNKKKLDCESDIKKFHDLIDKLERHIPRLKSKIESFEQTKKALEVELSDLEQDIQRLQTRIENQELSAHDIEQINQERARLSDQCHQVTDRQKVLLSQIQKDELHATGKKDILNDKIDEYRNICRRMKLLPATAKNALNFDYAIQLDPNLDGLPAVHELTQHLKNQVRKAALTLKQNRIVRGNEALDAALVLQDEMQRLEDRLRVESKGEYLAEDRVKKNAEVVRNERESREKAISRKTAETEDVELRIANISSEHNLGDDENMSRDRLAGLRKASTEMTEKYLALLDKNRHALTNVLTACTTHKSMVDNVITSLEAEVAKVDL